jgi:hypothetical protein
MSRHTGIAPVLLQAGALVRVVAVG